MTLLVFIVFSLMLVELTLTSMFHRRKVLGFVEKFGDVL